MAVAFPPADPIALPLVEADLPQALAIQAESFTIPWTERQYRDELALRWSHTTGLKDPATGDVLAVATWWTVGDELHLLNFASARAHRRQGLGRRLLTHVLAEGARESCTQAILEVRASNAAALRFYQRFGFEPIGERKGYYQDNGEDARVLRRSL